MSSDIAIDIDTGDVAIKNNDLILTSGIDMVNQKLRTRLRFFAVEWFLDTVTGMPYFQDILVKNPNINNIDNIIKTKIIETDDVTELLEYDSTFDNSLRTFSVTFKYRSTFGESVFSDTIF